MKGEKTDADTEEIRKGGENPQERTVMGGGGLEQRGRSRTEGTPHPGSLQARGTKEFQSRGGGKGPEPFVSPWLLLYCGGVTQFSVQARFLWERREGRNQKAVQGVMALN